MQTRYRDRREAGEKLAEELVKIDVLDALVLTIPRGGVVVAARVAEKLKFPLDIIIPRKIGAPFNPEMAIGAVTQDGNVLLNHRVLDIYNVSNQEIDEAVGEQINEIKRRMVEYRGSAVYPEYPGNTVILVDDGIATGFTVQAAIQSIKNIFKPWKIILAVPVAPPDTIKTLAQEVDEVVCLTMPDNFYAVGQFYQHFDQTSDEEVRELLDKSKKNKTRRWEEEPAAVPDQNPV